MFSIKAPYFGLKPSPGENPKILILGTIPSLESYESKCYYKNALKKKNSFWEILSNLFKEELTPESKKQLTDKGIALWDCLSECNKNIKNNSDNKIIKTSAKPVDMDAFLKKFPTIKYIILNGQNRRKGTPYYFNKFYKNLNSKYIIKALLSSTKNNRMDKEKNKRMGMHIRIFEKIILLH